MSKLPHICLLLLPLFGCQLTASHADVESDDSAADRPETPVEEEPEEGSLEGTTDVEEVPEVVTPMVCGGTVNLETDRYCLMVYNSPKNREEAEAHCQALGATLWDFSSDDRAVMIQGILIKMLTISRGLTWTGGVQSNSGTPNSDGDTTGEGNESPAPEWVWQNGEPVQGDLWESEPNSVDDGEGCLTLNMNNGFAQGRDCEEELPYFCGFWTAEGGE